MAFGMACKFKKKTMNFLRYWHVGGFLAVVALIAGELPTGNWTDGSRPLGQSASPPPSGEDADSSRFAALASARPAHGSGGGEISDPWSGDGQGEHQDHGGAEVFEEGAVIEDLVPPARPVASPRPASAARAPASLASSPAAIPLADADAALLRDLDAALNGPVRR